MTPHRSNPQISEEAAEWLVDLRTGEPEPAQLQQFDAWVRTSPEHLRAYLDMAAIWDEGHALDGRRQLSEERLLAAIQSEDNVVPIAASARAPVSRSAASSPVRRRKFLVAAAACGLAVIGALVSSLMLGRAPIYDTEAGEQRTLSLADGSVVTLNSRSRIRVRLSETLRQVDLLEGQALFKVAKDASRPFIVGSDNAQVRAVGTQFDVYRKAGGIVVTVLEGKVVVSGEASSADMPMKPQPAQTSAPARTTKVAAATALVAGEQLTVTDAGPGSATLAELPVVTAWTQRQLIFQSASLAEVAEEFNRYSLRKLVVEERSATPLRLSGVFSIDPQFLIGYLHSRPHVSVSEHGDEIRIVHDDGR